MKNKHSIVKEVKIELSIDVNKDCILTDKKVKKLLKEGKYSIRSIEKEGTIYCDGVELSRGLDGIYYQDYCKGGYSGCILSDCHTRHSSLRMSDSDLETLKKKYPEKCDEGDSLCQLIFGKYKEEYKELLKERYPDGIDYDFSGSCDCDSCTDGEFYDDEDK